MKKYIIVSGLLISALLFAGCEKDFDSANKIGNDSQETAFGQDLCELFTPTEIGQIVGSNVVLKKGYLPQTDSVQGCGYEQEDGYSINFIVNKLPGSEQSKVGFDSVLAANPESVKLDGLGEEALYWQSPALTNLTTYRKGIYITSSSTIGSKDQQLSNIKSLAELIWSKLL